MPIQRSCTTKDLVYAVLVCLCGSWIINPVAVFYVKGVAGDNLAEVLAASPSDPHCYNFSKGIIFTEKGGEFFSPNYPSNYYNNLDCNLTLIAPSNHRIEVDFRERFQVEPDANCEHDYLDFYDGLGGHRHKLDRLCGMEFPKDKIFSSGRFLHLRFKSDDTAEYGGFKGVFFYRQRIEKVLPISETCEFTESNSEGIIGTDNFSDDYREYSLQGNEINCIWVINVTKTFMVSLYFWKFELRAPNNCEKNFLNIYAGRLDDEHRIERLCGTQAKNRSVKDFPLYLYLYETPIMGAFSYFQLHYSIYRRINTTQVCTDHEFDCDDMSCIDSSLRCNGRQNCKFNTDEENCAHTYEESFLYQDKVLLILIIGLLLLLSLTVAMIVSCRRQWNDLNQRREELASRFCVPIELDQPDLDDGCYVPEVDLTIFQKRSNGGNAVVFDQEPPPIVRLDQFHHLGDSQSAHSPTPPPPPPPLYRNNTATPDGVLGNQSQAVNTSNTSDQDGEEAADVFPPSSSRQPVFDNRRLRSKAIIQMDSDRQQSFESTKSAPDVIGRH